MVKFKKKGIILAVLCMALLCLSACQNEKKNDKAQKNGEAVSLYERGLAMVELLYEMAGSDAYSDMMGSTDDIRRMASKIRDSIEKCDVSKPEKVYKLTFRSNALQKTMKELGMDLEEYDAMSDSLKSHLERRTISAVANIINSRAAGALALATSSIYAGSSVFVSDEFKDDVIYLYCYPDSYPVMVTFTGGEDNAVTASGVFILCEPFQSGDAEEYFAETLLSQMLEYMGVDIEDVTDTKR